jgi:hypothetical protein
MFRQITVKGLGPHDRFTAALDPGGAVEIRGPSEAGKSTLIEAICLALWGCGSDGKRFRPEAIREGFSQAEVILESAGGGVIRRVVGRSGRGMIRSLLRRGDASPRLFSSEAAFAGALGPLGERADAARLALAPLQWTTLAAGPGRALRDLLLEVLPGEDLSDEVARRMAVAGSPLRRPAPGDTPLEAPDEAVWTEKMAVEARRDARRTRDEARGALGALEAAAERDTLGAERAVQAVEASFARAIELRDRLQSAGGVCPTCRRPGWLDTQPQVEEAERAVDAHREQLRRARADLEAAEREISDAGAALEAARAGLAAAERRAEHLDHLVAAIRAAPTAALGRRLAALEPLGPVRLETSEAAPMLVRIDGRPWWLASRGRLVVADLWLRAALRRALEMPWLPLFVDNVQDVAGQPLPAVSGPLVLLRTAEGPLEVKGP